MLPAPGKLDRATNRLDFSGRNLRSVHLESAGGTLCYLSPDEQMDEPVTFCIKTCGNVAKRFPFLDGNSTQDTHASEFLVFEKDCFIIIKLMLPIYEDIYIYRKMLDFLFIWRQQNSEQFHKMIG